MLEQKGVTSPFLNFAARLEKRIARAIMKPMFKSGSNMIRYNNLKESQAELDPLLDRNSLLVIVTNHISHSDIVVGLKLVEEVKSRFPDRISNFYIPVSKSLVEGKQGHIAQLFYSEGTLPLLTQQNIKPLPLVTENDQKKRLMKSSYNETKQLFYAAKEDKSALLAFAEGSVEGGRCDAFGNEKGLQQVTNPFLSCVFQKAHEAGKNVVVLPVGISGTNRLLSADSLFLTPESIGALFQDWVFKKTPILAKVTLGHPYEYPNESGRNLMHNPQSVNRMVMESVASLVPEKGYYDPTARVYQQDMETYEEWRPFLVAPWRILFRQLPSNTPSP